MRVLRESLIVRVMPQPEVARSPRRRLRNVPSSAICRFRKELFSLLTTVLTMAVLCGGCTLAGATEAEGTITPRLDEVGLQLRSEDRQTTGLGMAQVELGNINATTTTHGRRELRSIIRTDDGQARCKRNIWWDAIVDPANYKFGCREIQVNYLYPSAGKRAGSRKRKKGIMTHE